MKSKLILLFVCLTFLALGQRDLGSIQSQTDITGSGAAVQLCAGCADAKWVQITTLSTNSAVVRWGDKNVSTTHGAAIAAGGGQFLPTEGGPYQLAGIWLYIASNDKVTATWGY